MKVKITGCSGENYWYSERIGEIFEVQCDEGYMTEDDAVPGHKGHIDTQDCTIIKEDKMNKVEAVERTAVKFRLLKADFSLTKVDVIKLKWPYDPPSNGGTLCYLCDINDNPEGTWGECGGCVLKEAGIGCCDRGSPWREWQAAHEENNPKKAGQACDKIIEACETWLESHKKKVSIKTKPEVTYVPWEGKKDYPEGAVIFKVTTEGEGIRLNVVDPYGNWVWTIADINS
ncbi:unnamed protein product, partial [marine sediment metagenome]